MLEVEEVAKKAMQYYSLEPALSRGASMNFVIGDRSGGKTYACKKWGFITWKKTRAEWVYVRRNTDEIEACKHNLWDDILPEEGYETKVKGFRCFIRESAPVELEGKEKDKWHSEHPWEPFGYYIAVSEAQDFKSATFPKVDKIFFDEFIIENPRRRYINNAGEVQLFLGLVLTISRSRKVKVVALANAGFLTNPYFQHYGVKSRDFDNTNFVRREKGAVLFEMFRSENNAEVMEKTTIGLIAGDEFKNYAIYSKFKDGGNEMVKPKLPESRPWIKITQDGNRFLTIYTNERDLEWWVGEANPAVPAYCLVKWDQVLGTTFDPKVAKALESALNKRRVSFASPDVRSLFIDWVRP